MKPQSYARLLGAAAIIALTSFLSSREAAAQGVDADRVNASLTLDASHFPVTITYVYRLGRVPVTYTSNGSYSQPAAELGALESIVIFGTTLHLGAIDNETTPGTGRAVLVSFTSAQEQDASITATVEAHAVD